jgi:hypothetical protein
MSSRTGLTVPTWVRQLECAAPAVMRTAMGLATAVCPLWNTTCSASRHAHASCTTLCICTNLSKLDQRSRSAE